MKSAFGIDYFCLFILLFSLFLLLFMSLTVLFSTIYGFHYTISVKKFQFQLNMLFQVKKKKKKSENGKGQWWRPRNLFSRLKITVRVINFVILF